MTYPWYDYKAEFLDRGYKLESIDYIKETTLYSFTNGKDLVQLVEHKRGLYEYHLIVLKNDRLFAKQTKINANVEPVNWNTVLKAMEA